MNWNQIVYSLSGGVAIGIAVTLMLLLNGRVTGISGIVSGALGSPVRSNSWRGFFILGLLVGGAAIYALKPELFTNSANRNLFLVGVAGLLVGYGTVMGGGCTSGHGVCGISRFSVRSLVATVTFMFFGFLTVQILRHFSGGAL